jgi:predicted transcriptional regulator of viral defense system
MKRTSLTTSQRDLLETLIGKHGLVVTTQDIMAPLGFATEERKYRFVSQLCEAGWLVRIKHGLYQIADVSSLGSFTLSRFTIASLLHPESYVSFLTALQFHGLFDQSLQSVSSVSIKRKVAVVLQGTRYRYVMTKEAYYFGFTSHAMDAQRVQIAQAEKALIDLMQFHRTGTTVDLVLETLRDNHHQLDLKRLIAYAQRSPVAVQRVLGFLLEALHLETGELAQAAQASQSVTRLSRESSQFSSTWRLYYDPYFIRDLIGA